MSWIDAAAIPEAFITAFDALFARGRLAPGEVLLVQAAGSGVGTAAVQLACAAGATVIGLSRTAVKRERLAREGLEHVFDPGDSGVADRVLHVGGGHGVDLVLDMVGAAAWPLHARVLRERGRIVIIGLLGGARCEIDFGWLMNRRATISGSVLRARPLEEKIALVQEFSRRALPLFAQGKLKARVDRTLPLQRVAEAHELMERNENLGKIVLEIGDD
jgi:NADPH:quinone reductase-like Zn-dependent oxidoreductase